MVSRTVRIRDLTILGLDFGRRGFPNLPEEGEGEGKEEEGDEEWEGDEVGRSRTGYTAVNADGDPEADGFAAISLTET